ncbi:MAG TPA: tetratricopeptide repeat protein [Polyangium sp.]|nr:tetratricopeptide repeat protein [Polyangium sp.]
MPSISVRQASSENVTEANRALATIRYKAGHDLLSTKDYEGALALFLRSRELWPRGANTKNAAICLSELGRYPEALALFEEVLGHFSDEFTSEEIAAIGDVVADLRKKVLSVEVLESSGTFAIDDESCGSLPRKEPVYLLPGSHVLHVLRQGKPEVISQFSGAAGQRIRVQIAPPPPPPTPPAPKKNEGWFATIASGPVFGFSTGSDSHLGVAVGGIGSAKGGYQFANGWSLALDSGAWYSQRNDSIPTNSFPFGQSSSFSAQYEIQQQVQSCARYMGFVVGIEHRINKRFDFNVRNGLGIIGLQSRQVLGGTVRRVDQSDTRNVIAEGAQRLTFLNPAYAIVDVGIMARIGLFRIGFSLEAFITFRGSDFFPTRRVQPSGDPCLSHADDGNTLSCIPALIVPRAASDVPTAFLVPQIVFGLYQ